MTLRTAFILAVVAGMIAGASVGQLRKVRDPEKKDYRLQASMIGGYTAATIFAIVMVLNAVLYPLLGPTSPQSILAFTILGIVIFAFACARM
jgi:hypothetical protein